MDVDPLQIEGVHYDELVDTLMVEATNGFYMEVEKGEQIYVVVDAKI